MTEPMSFWSGLAKESAHIFRVRDRVRATRLVKDRAWEDFTDWVNRKRKEMSMEIAHVNDDHAARGIYGSGITLKKHRQIRESYVSDVRAEWTKARRSIEDAELQLGAFGRFFLRRSRKGKEPEPDDRRLQEAEALFLAPDEQAEG